MFEVVRTQDGREDVIGTLAGSSLSSLLALAESEIHLNVALVSLSNGQRETTIKVERNKVTITGPEFHGSTPTITWELREVPS